MADSTGSTINRDPDRHGEIVFGAPLKWRSHSFRWTARLLAKGVFWRYFKMKVVNGHHIPETGPVIIAPSHRSNLDTPMIGVAFPRWMRFMAKESMFKSPFWSQFLTGLGGFPVKRGTLDRRALTNALEILKRGEALTIFPEGARQEGPRIKPIFEGAVWIASRSNVPIVPVGIGGSANAQPIGVKIPRPTPVHFFVGEPMAPPRPLPGRKRVGREQLDDFASELRERLQELFDEAQASVGSPNGEWADADDERRQPWDER